MTKLKEVMSKNVKVVEANATLKDAAVLMKRGDLGMLPVADQDKLVGTLTDRDITVRAIADGKDPAKTAVREVMTDHVFCCREDHELKDVLSHMSEQQIRRMPVLSKDNRLIGIVSLGDVAVGGGDQHMAGSALQRIAVAARRA